MGICKNIDISKMIDIYLNKKCDNTNSKVCAHGISKADRYLNNKINMSKNVIKKYSNNKYSTYKPSSSPYSYSPSYSPSYKTSSNSHSYRHPSNTTSNHKCNNLPHSSCKAPICTWYSREQVCKPNPNLCQNKKYKKICKKDSKCAWKNNRCYNESKL